MKVRFHTQTLYVEYKIRKKGKKLMRERERERERERKGQNEEPML